MLNDREQLSIIIPTYNNARTLSRCLASIFDNDTKAIIFDVIIVNDGSTDETANICLDFAKKYKNCKYIEQRNSGVSSARNAGIRLATKKYVMFVDGDDYLSLDWQTTVSSSIKEAGGSEMIVVTDYIDKDVHFLEDRTKLFSYITTLNKEGVRIPGPYSKIFLRRFLLDKGIKYKEDIINGEDMLFCLESAIAANEIYVKKGSFYRVWHNGASSTSKYDYRLVESESLLNSEVEIVVGSLDHETSKFIKGAFAALSFRSIIVRVRHKKTIRERVATLKKLRNNRKVYALMCAGFKNMTLKNKIIATLFRMKLLFFISVILPSSDNKEYIEEI